MKNSRIILNMPNRFCMKDITKILIFFLAFYFSAPVVALAKSNDCSQIMSKLEGEFYDKLVEFGESGSENDIKNAIDLVSAVDERCISTAFERAQISDLKGEINHMLYAFSDRKDEDFFKIALRFYNEALSFNTSRNEVIYWHLSKLMRTKRDYEQAMHYINKALNIDPPPKNPVPYLQTALQLTVDTGDWQNAFDVMVILSNKDPRYYRHPDLLLSSVQTLCHFNKLQDAEKIIQNVERYVTYSLESDKTVFQKSKNLLIECRRKNRDLAQ